jgi:hypothetical protein
MQILGNGDYPIEPPPLDKLPSKKYTKSAQKLC